MGFFPETSWVACSSIPEVNGPPRKVLWHKDVVLGTSLFPCSRLISLVYCPSHFFPHHWECRSLSSTERLRLHQLPLAMNMALWELSLTHSCLLRIPLPPICLFPSFDSCGEVLGGGDFSCSVSDKTSHKAAATEEDCVEGGVVCLDGEELMDGHALVPADKRINTSMNKPLPKCVVQPPPHVMTVPTLDTRSKEDTDHGPVRRFHFNFGNTFINPGDGLMDKDTITSVASEETLRGRCSKEECKHFVPKHNGPPFAMGAIINADVGNHGLQRGCVFKSDHPCYQIRLESGETVDTSEGEAALLAPRSRRLVAPDWDSPFDKVLQEIEQEGLKMGSYGMHSNAQQESLLLVEEAKAFAKAVKADDAKIPMHLWNDRVQVPGVAKARRDGALDRIRRLGYRFFRLGLLRDCYGYMAKAHSWDWHMKHWRGGKEEAINKLGRDQEAISNLLWHSMHTSWFEYNVGSRLIHFRFPERYRREARDGVKTFLKMPGPTTRWAQPTINDAGIRSKAKDKIAKVVWRRYLLTIGIVIKSYIKYFAVPKGEDDI
jgi:hypothetical protein